MAVKGKKDGMKRETAAVVLQTVGHPRDGLDIQIEGRTLNVRDKKMTDDNRRISDAREKEEVRLLGTSCLSRLVSPSGWGGV